MRQAEEGRWGKGSYWQKIIPMTFSNGQQSNTCLCFSTISEPYTSVRTPQPLISIMGLKPYRKIAVRVFFVGAGK